MGVQMAARCAGDWIAFLIDNNWPSLYNWCLKLGSLLLMLLVQWRDCAVRGSWSLIGSGMTALFIILWSCFLCLASMPCFIYVLLILGAAGVAIHYLGCTTGLSIAGLFGILTIGIYGNFWILGMLFIVGGYLFSQNHARMLIFMAIAYAFYCVYIRVGCIGIFLSTNLSFLSNDLFTSILQGYDCMKESEQHEESTKSEPIPEDFCGDSDFCTSASEAEDLGSQKSCKTSNTENVVKIEVESSPCKVLTSDSNSLDEMKRIMNSSNHYETLGFPRNKMIDPTLLKKEYRKKAVLVHPDKNMGNPLASESFKKLQCAYEVLSDIAKKRNYDELLRKEESRIVSQMCHSPSQRGGVEYRSEESRRVDCTKCGNTHLWICTNRSKLMARWCQDCRQYHQAKDGDGWVESGSATLISNTRKVEIPRAFVCAESKIFDVSEWAICQGMGGPNTHRPSFRVKMVGLDTRTQRSNRSQFPWGLDAEMMSEDEADFELWFQQALASGLFSETSQRRKSWSPFKITQKNGIMRQLRRFS